MNVTVKEFEKILRDSTKKGKVLYLDVRTTAEHTSERIPDVHNLPLQELEQHIDEIKGYDEVYVHCQSGRRSCDAQRILLEHGVKAINVDGGTSAWKESGQMLIKSRRGMPIIQQVLSVAGGLTMIGTLGAWLISPWVLLLTGSVGAGLLFAGVSGHCMMAYVLAKMPWNKSVKPMDLPWESKKA